MITERPDFIIAYLGACFFVLGIVGAATAQSDERIGRFAFATATGSLLIALSIMIFATSAVFGRDVDGRYANSPLKSWFDGLKSSRGPCCSDADGTALSDVDWEARGSRYRVRIEGEWIDVPEDAVITEPNRVGRTMVWPIYYRSFGAPVRIEIRCFMPGSMT